VPSLAKSFFSYCNPVHERSPDFLDAGSNSRSYRRSWGGLPCVLKNKKKTTRVPSLTFVYRCCYLFYLLRNMFAMRLIKLILLLHNSCSIWFHAWCCNAEGVVHTCIWNSVSTLGFAIFNLRNELFAKINTSLTPNSILSTFWNFWKSCS